MPPKRGKQLGGGLAKEVERRTGVKAPGEKAQKDLTTTVLNAMMYAFLGVLGLMLGAVGGFLAGQGLNTLIGGAIGLSIGLILAVFLTGHFRDAVEAGGDAALNVAEPLVPSFAREAAFGHDFFSILVTVHYVKTGADDALDMTKLSNFDGYVEVTCGSNPVKRTCVHPHCVYEETFKLGVRPRDKFIIFELKDQEMVKDELIGTLQLPVSAVIDAGFPVMKAFSLLDRRQTKVGNVMLSFDWGTDFPQDRLLYLQQQRPAEFARREQIRRMNLQSQQDMAQQAYAYGTFHQQSRVFAPGAGQP